MPSPSFKLRAAALTCVAAVSVPAAAEAKTKITMSGSTSVYPLAVQLAKRYVNTSRGTSFTILQGGSDVGINDVARDRVSIGNASRDPIPGVDPRGLQFNKIARDGVCVVTHPSNPIRNLSRAQIQGIFTGRVRSWSQIRGSRVSGGINLVTRTASSGTADAFRAIFMGQSLRISSSAAAKSTNGLVQSAVRSNRNAIGFVSFDFTKGTNPVGYRGVPCSLRNAKSGVYGGVRNFWMVTRGRPRGATRAFIDWAQNSSAARAVIQTNWIPVR